jgi:hypothetical protein
MLSADVNLADDERVFLIDEALEFRFGSLDGDATFAWRDMSGDDGDLWEFVSSKVSCNPFSLPCLLCSLFRPSLNPPIPCLKPPFWIACTSG